MPLTFLLSFCIAKPFYHSLSHSPLLKFTQQSKLKEKSLQFAVHRDIRDNDSWKTKHIYEFYHHVVRKTETLVLYIAQPSSSSSSVHISTPSSVCKPIPTSDDSFFRYVGLESSKRTLRKGSAAPHEFYTDFDFFLPSHIFLKIGAWPALENVFVQG